MSPRFQSTSLNRNFGRAYKRLDEWTFNPWRRYSLLLIVLLTGFLLGSSIGSINGVLALMDPIAAFLVVLLLEVMVRLRRHWQTLKGSSFTLNLIDFARIGLLYGLLLEGFKLF